MPRITFKAQTGPLLRHLKQFKERVYFDATLINELVTAQRAVIERNVKLRILTKERTTPPEVRKYPSTRALEKIASNVDSGIQVLKGVKELRVWTGSIAKLDAQDPLLRPPFVGRTIKDDKVRLWRIIESGTLSKNYAILPKHKKSLRFVVQGKTLQSKYIGGKNYIVTQKVIHPGIEPSNVFFRNNSFIRERQISYGEDMVVRERLKRALANYVLRYSG